MSETRKLAAILVADVVGYSRLAGADEDRILARLRALRSDLIDPIISVHHGRIVKRTGDGSIIDFRSVVDAVRCAIEVQTGMVERNAGLPPERRIEFRIGIHLGDVVEESDGDLMGDGVNIARALKASPSPAPFASRKTLIVRSRDGSTWRSAISARPNSKTSPSRTRRARAPAARSARTSAAASAGHFHSQARACSPEAALPALAATTFAAGFAWAGWPTSSE
jgi:class 3 adenylate cyclase